MPLSMAILNPVSLIKRKGRRLTPVFVISLKGLGVILLPLHGMLVSPPAFCQLTLTVTARSAGRYFEGKEYFLRTHYSDPGRC